MLDVVGWFCNRNSVFNSWISNWISWRDDLKMKEKGKFIKLSRWKLRKSYYLAVLVTYMYHHTNWRSWLIFWAQNRSEFWLQFLQNSAAILCTQLASSLKFVNFFGRIYNPWISSNQYGFFSRDSEIHWKFVF